ncbi:hypothetical protein DNTS_023682 [Danionella cerebrum]|uniref:Fibronectin type-III domain-containing protein n=1 Tax=Danionella cerebrum TaxID=2873325 RepID=A0A553MMK6_9TELE|nr:hypothetical protein DNTS_023682 [Danionella translucida]
MPSSVSCPGDLIVTGFLLLFSEIVTSEIWTNEAVPGLRANWVCLQYIDSCRRRQCRPGRWSIYWAPSVPSGIHPCSLRQDPFSDAKFSGLGSRVTLTCAGSLIGSPVEWRFNGSSVPPWQTHEGSLLLLNTTQAMEGNYSCHDEQGALLQSIKLRMGRNLKGSFSRNPCEQEDLGLNECTITDPPLWSALKFLVNITEINPLGSNSTIIQIDPLQLLKPDPPEDVQVFPVEGEPTQLLVQWSCPPSWPVQLHIFPLKFLLRYRPVGSKYWSMLDTEGDMSVKIMDALLGHLHEIQIRAQDALINHSQWSEWSHMVEAQPWIELDVESTEEPVDYNFSAINLSPVKTTEKSPDSSLEQFGGLRLLVLLGLFAGVMVTVLLTIITLLWLRQRKQNNVKKQELASMVKMKSVPI